MRIAVTDNLSKNTSPWLSAHNTICEGQNENCLENNFKVEEKK